MLTPEQITALGDTAEVLTEPLVDWLIQDIAERVAEAGQLTSTAAYEVWRAQNLGLSLEDIKKRLQKKLGVTASQLETLLTQAAETGYNFDLSRLPTAKAIPFAENTTLQQIVNAAVKLAKDDLSNMTQTIGFVGPDGEFRELTDAYNQVCDFAFQKVSTGAQDYISAVRDATRELAAKGIRVIDYESGVHTSIEAAIRRNVMGGLGLMQEQISQQNHDDFGCNGWEISAHAASAPDHEPIQGKQYSDKAYIRLNNSLVRRIGTLFCGHAGFPIILGVNSPQYTPEELERFRQENEKGITYQGRHYTLYEATQKQRQLECTIRKQEKRIIVDEALGDKDKLQNDQIRYHVVEQEYRRFSKAAGLRLQHDRMEVGGFGPKQVRAAEKTIKESQPVVSAKKVEISGKYDTMKATPTNGTDNSVGKNSEVAALHHVTRLDIEKYKCVSESITTDEVIMTDERIQHIRDRHPNDFERYERYIREIIEKPDFILEANKPNTAFILKKIQECNEHFELILRLAVQGDPDGYKNSVITFLRVEEKRYNRYLRTKKILYKSE